ncbi:hypothetical protein [Phormidesmis sp. 146-33]
MDKLRLRGFMSVIMSLVLVTVIGIYTPAYAVIDCDANPTAPKCSGEPIPKPKPKPIPKPAPAPAPITNYPAAIAFILQRSDLIEQTIDTVWRDFGKGVAAQQIKDQLNGKRVGKGMRIKDVNVNLRDVGVKEVTAGPGANQVSVRVVVPQNNENFHVSVPVVPDPSFRVFHTLNMNLIFSVDTSSDPIKVNQLSVQVADADIRGSNLVGTVVKSVGDFFTGGSFSSGLESRINQNRDLTNQLAGTIKSAIDRLPIPR